MSDAVTVAIITAISNAVLLVITRWMGHRQISKVDKKMDAGLEKVEAIGKQVDTVEKQGNSNFGEQLRIAAVSAKTLAAALPTSENISLADAAIQKLELHEDTQNQIAAAKFANGSKDNTV